MNHLISLIIPVYNAQTYLPRCLDSVLAQTHQNLEIILIDDGSADKSGEICDEYAQKDARIRVIHQKNAGVSAARNAGLRVAKGEYIGFVDADDFIEADMYRYLLASALQYRCAIAVCSVFGKPPLIKAKRPLVLTSLCALDKLYTQSYIHNKLFHIRVLQNIYFRPDIAICEDLVFCFQTFGKTSQVVYCLVPQYHSMVHPQSASHCVAFSDKKLSVFRATQFVRNHATRREQRALHKKISQTEAYMATGLLRSMMNDGINRPQTAKHLQHILRKNLGAHLVSSHKLSNKLFALVCCVNFKWAGRIYRGMRGRK